jgi:hypothetical protein
MAVYFVPVSQQAPPSQQGFAAFDSAGAQQAEQSGQQSLQSGQQHGAQDCDSPVG